MVDFKLKSRYCGQCLLVHEEDAGDNLGLCPKCATAFSYSSQEKLALWSRQLKLFLDFDRDQSGDRAHAVVMWSGGSDSTLALFEAKYTLGLNVIALRFEFGFERKAMQETAKDFCKTHLIPLITIRVDLKTMYRECYRDESEITLKTITDFPWDRFSASGGDSFVWKMGTEIAAMLGIRRIICGNNFAYFEPLKNPPNPDTWSGRFVHQNFEWLNPVGILLVNPLNLLIHLPLALGYTKTKKLKKLEEIHYRLPEHCYATTDSDSQLGLLLHAANRKVAPDKLFAPYASAYSEFFSGYLTREQWLETLIKANHLSQEDVEGALQYFRTLLTASPVTSELSVTVNKACQDLLPEIDFESVQKELRVDLGYHRRILLARYLINIENPISAANHAKAAIADRPDGKAGYRCLGRALVKSGRHKEALAVYKQGVSRFPGNLILTLGQAACHFHLKQFDTALNIVQSLKRPDKATEIAYNIDRLHYRCLLALGQVSQARECLNHAKENTARHLQKVIRSKRLVKVDF